MTLMLTIKDLQRLNKEEDSLTKSTEGSKKKIELNQQGNSNGMKLSKEMMTKKH